MPRIAHQMPLAISGILFKHFNTICLTEIEWIGIGKAEDEEMAGNDTGSDLGGLST